MSYVLSAYLIDISKIAAIIGSKNSSLIEPIKAANPDQFEDVDDDDEDDELTLSAALEQLIMGQMTDSEDAYQYGYALVAVCNYAGELQMPELWNGVRWEAIEKCGLAPLLTRTGPPVALPPSDDFPRVGHIQRNELKKHITKAKDTEQAVQDGDIKELLEEFTEWLETAAERELDLAFFYY